MGTEDDERPGDETSRIEERLDRHERAVNRYMKLGIVIGTPIGLMLLSTAAPEMAVVLFLALSVMNLLGVEVMAGPGRTPGQIVMMGAWIGMILAFVLAFMYHFYLPFLAGVFSL